MISLQSRSGMMGTRFGIGPGCHVVAPLLHQLLRPPHPVGPSADGLQDLYQPSEGGLGIPVHSHFSRVGAAQFPGVNVDLDDRSTRRGNTPLVGDLAACVAADVEDQVCLVDHPVGAPAGVGADHADRQRVVVGYGALGVEGGGHRDVQHLGQFHHFLLRLRGRDAATGHDHRPLCRCQGTSRRPHALRVGLRAEGWTLREGGLEYELQVPFGFSCEVAGHSLDVQVYRRRRTGGCLAKGLPQQLWQLLRVVHHRAEFRDRRKGLGVLDFLVGVPVLLVGALVSGQGNDRRQSQVGVLQPGSQVGRAHGLGHADAGLARGAGVTVGHVSGGLFPVGDYALDAYQVHFGQRAPKYRRHQEDVGNAVGLEHVGHEFSASHLRHIYSPKLPP